MRPIGASARSGSEVKGVDDAGERLGHPFGQGKELFFWSLIVAVLVFGIGGGVSFYEGIVHVRTPTPLEKPMWNYIVLAAAFCFEGVSFGIALREFRRQAKGRPFWQALHGSKDPTTYTVLAEDGAALTGLLIAAAGVYASHRWNRPELDGVASIAIGLLLAGVAALLVRESRGLLIGEGIRKSTADEVCKLVLNQAGVTKVSRPLSMYLGREEVLVALSSARAKSRHPTAWSTRGGWWTTATSVPTAPSVPPARRIPR